MFTGISIHHAMSLTGKRGVKNKIISENEIILITDGRLHESIQKGCIEPWHGAPLSVERGLLVLNVPRL